MSVHFSSLNGQATNSTSLFERGLAFGDGHFTTAKIVQGKVQLLDEHIVRLKHGCQVLNINYVDWSWLSAYVEQVSADHELAVLKVMITAGQGGRGYARTNDLKPNVYTQVSEFPTHYANWQQQGITLGVAQNSLSQHPVLAGIKHLNRLEQVLIRQELEQREEQELLVKAYKDEHIISASCGNLFYFIEGVWFTPKLTDCGINGIMRQHIINRMLADNITVTEIDTSEALLEKTQAMFITNALMQMVPIKNFNQREQSLIPVFELQKQLAL